MKQKVNARQKRDAEAQRRKDALSLTSKISSMPHTEPPISKQVVRRREILPAQSEEEELREFMEYLDRHGVPAQKEEIPVPAGKKQSTPGNLPVLNLEQGMPVVNEAVSRMHMGLQELRTSRAAAVKLIHGYGSTGRGGKICIGVREELAVMKRKKLIKDFIPGEDFGPTDAAARKLAEQFMNVTRDPDYGRMNHGITIVVL